MSLLIRTQQHWLPRSIDVLLTVLAWGGFLGLIYVGIRDLAVDHVGVYRSSFLEEIKPTLETLCMYALTGGLIGIILLLWAKYSEMRARNHERRHSIAPVAIQGLSSSFRVSAAVIEFLQSEQVWIVHNHEYGDLSAIEIPAIGVVLPAYAGYEQVQQVFSDDPNRFVGLLV